MALSALGKYKIQSVLGQGAAGTVYLALDTETGADVALKVLQEQLALDEMQLMRFVREAENTKKLRHPNILRVQDVGCQGDQYYICMEYVQGRDLKDVIDVRQRFPVGAVLGIARRMASALECSHAAGIVHRDIKPHNIFVGVGGLVKLGDFGLARQEDGSDMVTLAQTVMGTPAYMPREQILCEHVDIRSDIYSLGATLYHALSSRPPFAEATTLTELLRAQIAKPPPPLPRECMERCRELCELILDMLQKAPEARPQAPAELLARLESCGQAYQKGSESVTTTLDQIAQRAAPTLTLTISAPSREPETRAVRIKESLAIGRRPDNDIPVPDEHVSRSAHARIEARGEDLVLVPNPEKRSLRLNGERVSSHGAPLQVGDRIAIGKSEIVIEAGEVATRDEIEETIAMLVAEAEGVSPSAAVGGGDAARATAAARLHCDRNRPWCGRMDRVGGQREGRETMAIRRFLTTKGFSGAEVARLIQELREARQDHFAVTESLRERSDFCGMLLDDDEITLVIPKALYDERMRGQPWGSIIRYRSTDWFPIKKREVDANIFVYLKQCKIEPDAGASAAPGA